MGVTKRGYTDQCRGWTGFQRPEKWITLHSTRMATYEQRAYLGCSLHAPLIPHCRSCCPYSECFPHCWTDSTVALDTPSHVSPSPSSRCHQGEPASPGVARCTPQSRDDRSVEAPPARSCSISASLKLEWQSVNVFLLEKILYKKVVKQDKFVDCYSSIYPFPFIAPAQIVNNVCFRKCKCGRKSLSKV